MSIIKQMLREKGPDGTFEEARKVAREYTERLQKAGKISISEPNDRTMPTIHIVRRTVPEVWEDTWMALLGIGSQIHTHYDPASKTGQFTSFPSSEATVMMHIEEPFGEPRFHKHFLGGWMGFGDYKAEIEGVKDHWMIQPTVVAQAMKHGKFSEVKGDEKWNYTYSQRLRAYPYFDINGRLQTIDQLANVVRNLKRDPTSRSAQCVTWDARWDNNLGDMKDSDGKPCKWDQYHSPCLQRFWFRLQKDKSGKYVLNVNGHWRSRDHLKAAPSNIFGVTEGIHEEVRRGLERELGEEIQRGSYTDISDSLHLYGHYFDPRPQGLDAESYLEDVFRIASGEPLSERVIVPGTDMYDMMMEDIGKEYRQRVENPDFGRQ